MEISLLFTEFRIFVETSGYVFGAQLAVLQCFFNLAFIIKSYDSC